MVKKLKTKETQDTDEEKKDIFKTWADSPLQFQNMGGFLLRRMDENIPERLW